MSKLFLGIVIFLTLSLFASASSDQVLKNEELFTLGYYKTRCLEGSQGACVYVGLAYKDGKVKAFIENGLGVSLITFAVSNSSGGFVSTSSFIFTALSL